MTYVDSLQPPHPTTLPPASNCAAPVHQMKQYYMFGTVDDCTGHWRDLYNCLKKRTKFKDEASLLFGCRCRAGA